MNKKETENRQIRENGKMEINVIRSSRRKHLAISVEAGGLVTVRAPYGISRERINKVVAGNMDWIEKHLQKAEKAARERAAVPKLTLQELNALGDQAVSYIPARVRKYAREMGVSYGRITIRCQKTRWGSCSAKGNLNFNCLLMLAPPEVIDYVVVHELSHRKYMNHSREFWAEVEKTMPDYRRPKRWLKEHGGELMARLHG